MPLIREKETGRQVFISNENLQTALASGRYETGDAATVSVRTEAGRIVEAPVDAAAATPAAPVSEAERAGAEEKAFKEDAYGGAGGALRTFGNEFASAATAGLYDVAGRITGGEKHAKARQAEREVNPVSALAGTVAGTLVGAPSGGGAAAGVAKLTPVGMAASAGRRASSKLGGGLRGATASGGVEGLIVGAGSGAAEAAISEDPLTVERVAGSITSSALLGTGVGAGIGMFAKAAEKGLGRARGLVDEAGEKLRGTAGTAEDAVAKRAKVADDVLDYHRASADDGRWLIADADPQAKKILTSNAGTLRKISNTPESFRTKPGRVLEVLEAEENALLKLKAKQGEGLEKLAKEESKLAREVQLELDTLPDSATQATLTGKAAQKYGDFAKVKVSAKNPTVSITREEAMNFAEAMATGQVASQRAAAFNAIDDSILKVKSLRTSLNDAIAPVEVAKKGLLENAVSGSIYGATVGALPAMGALGPVLAPILGGKAAQMATDLVFGRLGKAAAEAAERTTKAVDRFISVAQSSQKALPPLASKVLTSYSYAEEPKRGPGRPKSAPEIEAKGETELVKSFRAREKEIRSQVGGNLKLTPAARQAIGARLAPVGAYAPSLADQIETLAARRVEYLASKLPRRPDSAMSMLGPDTWQPSDMAIRSFARTMAAVEDPGGVEERLADGTVTPEDADAYKAVYPERFEDLKRQIVDRLPELQKTLPYERRISLSIFSGVPVDPTMQPRLIARLQGNFAAEPGTEGGTQAPKPQPQFGSVSKDIEKPTPAQERSA